MMKLNKYIILGYLLLIIGVLGFYDSIEKSTDAWNERIGLESGSEEYEYYEGLARKADKETFYFVIVLITGGVLFFGGLLSSRRKKQPMQEIKSETETPKQILGINNCPKCDGKLSKLNHYQLKAGDSTECEYCGEMISV